MEQTPFQRELARAEVLAGLRHALDIRYRKICQTARADWERLFAGSDPSDARVSVRLTVERLETRAIRGCGFLKSPSQPIVKRQRLPRFAR
jgi:hypothetical protein